MAASSVPPAQGPGSPLEGPETRQRWNPLPDALQWAKRQAETARRRRGPGLLLLVPGLALALLASGCQRGPSEETRRLDRVDLKIQQLEQRLNKLSARSDSGADKNGKPPAGVIKSLTLRMGSEDDRLRIYWADGSSTDLPCTKEQNTFVCG